MPKVSKLSTKSVSAKKAKTGTLLDRVCPVQQLDSGGIKVSLYGRSKTGKTRLLSTFPKPVLILGSEDGTRSIRNIPDVFFVRIILDGAREPEHDNWIYLSQLDEFIESLRGSEYKTIGADTASALSDLVLASLLGLTEVPEQKSWGLATREQYGQQGLQLKTYLKHIIDLPQNIVITAHERNFNEESSSDLIFPTVGSALSPSVTGWLNGAVDYIAQTFIREQSVVKTSKIAGQETKIASKTGKSEYCLRIGPHPVYMTGFRLPDGSDLPEVIINPTYEKMYKIIQGVK